MRSWVRLSRESSRAESTTGRSFWSIRWEWRSKTLLWGRGFSLRQNSRKSVSITRQSTAPICHPDFSSSRAGRKRLGLGNRCAMTNSDDQGGVTTPLLVRCGTTGCRKRGLGASAVPVPVFDPCVDTPGVQASPKTTSSLIPFRRCRAENGDWLRLRCLSPFSTRHRRRPTRKRRRALLLRRLRSSGILRI